MGRQLARGIGSFFKECGCSRPTRCPRSYTIRFRKALGKQRDEVGYDTQDDVIESLTVHISERRYSGLTWACRNDLPESHGVFAEREIVASCQGALHEVFVGA